MESWDDGSLTIGLVCDEGFVCTPLRDTPDEHVDYALVVPRGVDVPGQDRWALFGHPAPAARWSSSRRRTPGTR
nr:hypothetical protein GCM10020093_111760 [Planobispora longispora]